MSEATRIARPRKPKGPQVRRTPELVDEILARIAKGEPLAAICREPGKPERGTFIDWVNREPELAERYGSARASGEEYILEECLNIADKGDNDWMERNAKDNPGWVANGEHIQRSKLRIETRLKLLAKWNPKRWGDKALIGSDPDNPLPATSTVDVVALAKALRDKKSTPGT